MSHEQHLRDHCSTGQVTGHTEKITVNEAGKLARADESLDMSAWDALSTQEREAVYADVKATPPTGWQSRSNASVPSVIKGA